MFSFVPHTRLVLAMRNRKKAKRGQYGKKGKLVLTFDEKARREYLTGFRKRKNQRKEIAKKALDHIIKEKKKEQKTKKREDLNRKVKKLLEGKDLLLEKWGKDQVPAALKGQETKVHFANHEVTVTSELDFASTGLVLGDNKDEEDDISLGHGNKAKGKKKVRFFDDISKVFETHNKKRAKGGVKNEKNSNRNKQSKQKKKKRKR